MEVRKNFLEVGKTIWEMVKIVRDELEETLSPKFFLDRVRREAGTLSQEEFVAGEK